MADTVIEQPIKIDILSDANYKAGQWMRLSNVISEYEYIKSDTDKILGKTTLEGTPAQVRIIVHYYDYASDIIFAQEDNVWKAVYSTFANDTIINKVTESINNAA